LSRFHSSPSEDFSASIPATDQLFAAAFENAPHPMALIDAQGQIVQANRSLCRMLGFTRGSLCALTASDIIHPDDAETEREQRRRLGCAAIGRYQLVQRYVRKDLRTVWARVSVSAIRTSSLEVTHFVAELEPVAPHNCAEALDHQVWFARLGDATLSAAHEIGNTLTALMLNAEMLVEDPIGAEVGEAANAIFKAGRRIAFALRRLRRVQEPQPVAYIGPNRMLDLRLLAPPDERSRPESSEAGAA
jgi:PAS domain S-box-containing protein